MNYCKKCSRILEDNVGGFCPYCGGSLTEGQEAGAGENTRMASGFPAAGMIINEMEPSADSGSTQPEAVKPAAAGGNVSEYNAPEPIVTGKNTQVHEPDLNGMLDDLNKKLETKKSSAGEAPTSATTTYAAPVSAASPTPYTAPAASPTPYTASAPSPTPYATPAPSPTPYATPAPSPTASTYTTTYQPYSTATQAGSAYAPAPLDDNRGTGVGYMVLAVFMPIIGIIVGIVMMNDNSDARKQRSGKDVLTVALLQAGFFVLMCCCVYICIAAFGTEIVDSFYYGY